jgi:hypothetical protein
MFVLTKTIRKTRHTIYKPEPYNKRFENIFTDIWKAFGYIAISLENICFSKVRKYTHFFKTSEFF